MWKVQCEKMTAINHSCWASFKYKSISIFHFYALEPKHPIFFPPPPSHPYPSGTLKKRISSCWFTTILIGLQNLSFLTAISRCSQSLIYMCIVKGEKTTTRACWSSIKNVHTRWKLIFCFSPHFISHRQYH